jgi:hypothetical protein
MRSHQVRCLLMGGQACIVYGAAEFSRDADLAVLADDANLARLGNAFANLNADVIAVPPFERDYLERGHAVHFRCRRADVTGLRVDVMARMRGVAPFAALWERRTTLALKSTPEDETVDVDVLALSDLVAAKKTQRDKDWPMLRRLMEVSWFTFRDAPTEERVHFWLQELRTPELLIECVATWTAPALVEASSREAVRAAIDGDKARVERELANEQERERALDRTYWAPLREELERLRRGRPE